MATTLEQVTDLLDEENWQYTVNTERNYISMRMKMKTVDSCGCIVDVRDDTTVLFYTTFPIKIPEERRDAVMKFLTYANFGLHHGNFEMNLTDGQIRYKTTGMTTPEDVLDNSIIHRLIGLGCLMIDRYAPGILSVLYANDDPAHAVARIENAAAE